MDENAKRLTRQHAALVTKVQEDLRMKCRNATDEEIADIWAQHCDNVLALELYARSMRILAQEGWETWLGDSSNQSRVVWCRRFYRNYYFHDRDRWENDLMSGDGRIARYHDLEVPVIPVNLNVERVRLLDVGSCYNPFGEFDEADTYALDLAPAAGTGVAKCDFINVVISENGGHDCCWLLDTPVCQTNVYNSGTPVVKQIFSSSFDVVIMSLVLSYFPTPAMRFRCCRNAWEVLKPNGLLLIVTPDSRRNGKNDPMVKSWKIGLGFLGFQRIAHDKLAHVQCMAFRKNPLPGVQKKEAERMLRRFRLVDEKLRETVFSVPFIPENLMFIPQDFRDESTGEIGIKDEAVSAEEKVEGFCELPLSLTSDNIM